MATIDLVTVASPDFRGNKALVLRRLILNMAASKL